MPARSIQVEKFHDVAIAKILTENLWQRDEIQAMQGEVLAYIRAERPIKLILDLSRVERVSSEAITALLKLRDETAGGNCKMRLCNLQAAVTEVLQITDLTRLFDIHESLPDAFRGFATFPQDDPLPE